MKPAGLRVVARQMAAFTIVWFVVVPAAMAQVVSPSVGRAGVFCVWNIYVTTEAAASYCGLPRTAGDEVLQSEIARIDAFIVANAKHPPYTQQELDAGQQKYLELTAQAAERFEGKAKFCENPHLSDLRNSDPKKIESFVDDLLSVPREPLMDPCI